MPVKSNSIPAIILCSNVGSSGTSGFGGGGGGGGGVWAKEPRLLGGGGGTSLGGRSKDVIIS